MEEKIKENGIIEHKTIIKIGPFKTDKNNKRQRIIFY